MLKNRKPNRLKNYDYSGPGWYFVTICTHDKAHIFGRIENGKMVINRYGEVAQKYWVEIPDHFEIVELDQFVIMPNHVHGIIIIHDVGDVHGRPLRRQHMLLSTVVQHYKAAVSKWIHRMENEHFKWQKSFYDHVIRDDFSLGKIREYIQNNPMKWEYDRENMNGISAAVKKQYWREFYRKEN